MMRRRVLLVQPSLQPPGGGNGVAAWMLQALATEHDVTVLSWWPVEVEPINRFFGTALVPGSFHSHVVPATWRLLVRPLPVPAALFRNALLMRYARRLARDFDVVLGAHNEVDYGRRGIQYIHYPTYIRPRPDEDLRWYHRFGPLLTAYYSIADRVAGFSLDRMRTNVTLANSNWTAAHVRQFLGVDAQTLYPPVVGSSSNERWDTRRRSFLALGRISPEKEYERAIRIVAGVRQHDPATTLTIVGTYDAHTRRYFEDLKRIADSLDSSGTLVTFKCDIHRAELNQLMASHRYGLHAMRNEHFGMAPAEMASGGMIVWVPDGGGQTEIVGDAADLRYTGEADAIAKIVRVMSDASLERTYRSYLADRSAIFSTERFMQSIRTIVATFER
jgi:glycosyltransferase involved in cell wall biosynthesis